MVEEATIRLMTRLVNQYTAVSDFSNSYLKFAFCRSVKTLQEAAKRFEKVG